MKTPVVGLVAVILLLLSLAPPCIAQAPGLVSYWPGNGNYQDVVGGNNGTPVGGVSFVSGLFGDEAFRFDGSTGRIFIPDSSSLAITGPIGISAWIYSKGVPDGALTSLILFRGDDRTGLDPYILTFHTGNLIDFEMCDGTDEIDLYAPCPLNQWTFVAAGQDSGGTARLYINGVLLNETGTSIRPFANLDPSANPGVAIGGFQSDTYNGSFWGAIEEVRLYNAAFPAEYPTQLVLSRNSVVGGQSVTGQVTLVDAQFQTTSVMLGSNNSTASPPGSVGVGYGTLQSPAFTIRTSTVTSQQSAKISASLNGTTVYANLTVLPVPPAPTITSLSETSGLAGDSVTINGANFIGVSSVTFGGVAALYMVNSSTSITATAPLGGVSGAVKVTTPGGTATAPENFTYKAPTITSFAPGSAPVGTTVTISGTNLIGIAWIKFNGTAVASWSRTSTTSVTTTVPAGATTGKITLATPGGIATSPLAFTVN